GALQVSLTNGFVPKPGNFFNVLSCASRSGAFAASNAGLLGLTEYYTPTGLMLIAGSNAYPSLRFTVSGGYTQTVCVQFRLHATAADVDGAVTNLAVLLDGATIDSGAGAPLSHTVELDFPGAYTFTVRADDNAGGTTWATQQVTLVAYPLHWIISGGFRTNGAFKLCVAGETGRVYQVLGSTNLGANTWFPVGVMENTNEIWRFLDTGASNQSFRFYRAEQLP